MFNITWSLYTCGKIKLITGRRYCDGALVRPSVEHKSQHCSDSAIFTTADVQCHATLQTTLLKFIYSQSKERT